MKPHALVFGLLALSSMARAGNLPVITTHPRTQIVAPGSTATLTVTATGATAYQWRFNGVDIPAATTSSLAVTNAQTNNAGYYLVVAKNATGWVPSQLAYLSVVGAVPGVVPFCSVGNPNMLARYQRNPTNCYVDVSSPWGLPINGELALPVAGPELDQMQPLWGWVDIFMDGYFGYPGLSVGVPNVAPGQAVYYRVDVAYNACAQPSTTLKLVAGGNSYPTPSIGALRFPYDIDWPYPWIWPFDCNTGERSRTNQTLIPGELARLAACPGTFPPAHALAQWRKDGQPIAGATNSSLVITNFQSANVGVYDVVASDQAASWKFYLSMQTTNGQGVFRSPRTAGSDFVCDLEGIAGRNYAILRSTNLADWTNLLTLTNVTGTGTFTNAIGSNGLQYYRARLLP